MFAHATEAAKRPNKKISRCAVDTDIVVFVIPVVQQLGVDEFLGWQKSLVIIGMTSNCLVLREIKHPLFGCGKRWLSFSSVTG